MDNGVGGVAPTLLPEDLAGAEDSVERDPGVADPQRISNAAQARAAPRSVGSSGGLPVDAADSGFMNLAIEDGDGGNAPPTLALPKKMSAEQLVLLLYALQSKMGLETVKDSEARIEGQKLEREQKHEESLKKIEEMEKAREKAKNSSKIGQIFGWIGVGLAWLAVGVVAVASGGMAAAPLAVAATAMTAMMIAQETGATEKAMEAMDLSAKDAMIFQISMAVALLIVNIIAMVLSFGAASGGAAAAGASVAGTAAQTSTAATSGGAATAAATTSAASTTAATATSTAASTASTTAATTASTTATTATSTASQAAGQGAATSAKVVQTANKLRMLAQIAQAAGQAGGAGAQAATGAYNYEASMAQADADKARADLALIQEITLEELQRIRKMLEQLQQSRAAVNDIITSSNETASKIAMPA